MEIVGLIIFGGIVGWLASILMHTDKQQGILGNIIVGIVGSMIGGFIVRMFGGSGVTGFNLKSILTGVFGAIVLIFIFRLFSSGRSRQP